MGKAKELLLTIPGRLNIPLGAEKRMKKTFELVFDYEFKNKGAEFCRFGDSMENCEERLDIVFSIIDRFVFNYSGNSEAATEGKKLLLLASTPDVSAQQDIVDKYGEESGIFKDVITEDEVKAMGFWN